MHDANNKPPAIPPALPQFADDAPTLPPGAPVSPPQTIDPFMTGRIPAVPTGTQHLKDAFDTEPDRVSYGIWGAAIGTLVGIFLGVMNAFLEGLYPSENQGPLIIFTLLGMVIGGAISAYKPKTISRIIKDLFYFYN